ncbi:MAG: hypothetical protein EOO40_10790, partial [Deltaproteobacteria bacterium]
MQVHLGAQHVLSQPAAAAARLPPGPRAAAPTGQPRAAFNAAGGRAAGPAGRAPRPPAVTLCAAPRGCDAAHTRSLVMRLVVHVSKYVEQPRGHGGATLQYLQQCDDLRALRRHGHGA